MAKKGSLGQIYGSKIYFSNGVDALSFVDTSGYASIGTRPNVMNILSPTNPEELDIRYNAIEGANDLIELHKQAKRENRRPRTLVLTSEQLHVLMADVIPQALAGNSIFGMEVSVQPSGNLF